MFMLESECRGSTIVGEGWGVVGVSSELNSDNGNPSSTSAILYLHPPSTSYTYTQLLQIHPLKNGLILILPRPTTTNPILRHPKLHLPKRHHPPLPPPRLPHPQPFKHQNRSRTHLLPRQTRHYNYPLHRRPCSPQDHRHRPPRKRRVRKPLKHPRLPWQHSRIYRLHSRSAHAAHIAPGNHACRRHAGV